ncbi:hypothetical protein PoB_006638100 [Plakobranchus ocellatus]|uniref:Uncharacterized protein n=1 Tax=Plakobranchus ocellatus TaxID=259542 RepID=A0AAV4D735_9GAST|nr:hypothetical protein PoB_006638100 [Plakobranchus ocellatus]
MDDTLHNCMLSVSQKPLMNAALHSCSSSVSSHSFILDALHSCSRSICPDTICFSILNHIRRPPQLQSICLSRYHLFLHTHTFLTPSRVAVNLFVQIPSVSPHSHIFDAFHSCGQSVCPDTICFSTLTHSRRPPRLQSICLSRYHMFLHTQSYSTPSTVAGNLFVQIR